MSTTKLKDPDYFIVGLQKSGTYWLTPMLDTHPEIKCLPTLYDGQNGVREGRVFDMLESIDEDGGRAFRHSFLNYHDGFYADLVPLMNSVSKKELYDLFKDRYSKWHALHNKEGKRLVGDKTTEYIFHLDLIDSFYPNIKKICIIREPRDRVVSWHFHEIRKGRKKDGPVTDRFVHDYVTKRIKKEYESMLAYTGDLHCLTYENLSKDTGVEIKSILEYLGAKQTPEIIERMIDEASIESLRKKDTLHKDEKEKKKGEEVAKSHYRKGVVGDWQNYLNDKQLKIIKDVVGELHNEVIKKYIKN